MSDLPPETTDAEEQRIEPQPTVETNFDAIIDLISDTGAIANLEEGMNTNKGELGAYYKKIQNDHHGNIGAVKKIKQLKNMKSEKRNDFMRTFLGLAERMGLMPETDMVDMAQNNKQSSVMDDTVSDLEKARDKKKLSIAQKDNKTDGGFVDPEELIAK